MCTMCNAVQLTGLADGHHEGYRDICDFALMSKARTGDHNAFTELCRRHSSKLTRRIRRIVRDRSDAEDILQETLLSAYTHLKSFEGRSSVLTWLTKIAINAALSSIRKTRHISVPIDDDMGEETRTGQFCTLRDHTPDPERQLIQSQKQKLLAQAIHRLPPRLRSVLELRVKHGHSGKQIADKLGISESAVKSRLMRAYLRLHTREGARVHFRRAAVQNYSMSRG